MLGSKTLHSKANFGAGGLDERSLKIKQHSNQINYKLVFKNMSIILKLMYKTPKVT